jgi:transposase-like protein
MIGNKVLEADRSHAREQSLDICQNYLHLTSVKSSGSNMRPDNKKLAAMALLKSGRATISEVARLVGTSRQRVQHWVKYGIDHKGPPWRPGPTKRVDFDVQAAREEWLAKQWQAEIVKALEVEDHATEREWGAAFKRMRRRLSAKAES